MMYLATAVNEDDKELAPKLVSFFTHSKPYHSELVFSDGTAVVVSPSFMGWKQREYDYYKWMLLPLVMINEEQEQEIREVANKLLGDDPKYDYLGACCGWIRNWMQDPNKWYCSELCRALLRPYIPLILDDDKWITPDRLLRILSTYMKIDNRDQLSVLKSQL